MARPFNILLALAVLSVPAYSVPPGFNIQGRLTDSSGVNREGVFAMKFSVFDSPVGGQNLWTRTFPAVTVRNGNFQLILTDPADNPAQVFSDAFAADGRHLEIQVISGPGVTAPEVPLVPRQQLVSVPFSLKSGALTSPDTAITANIAGVERLRIDTVGNLGIGTASPAQKLDVFGNAQLSGGAIINQIGPAWGGWNESIRFPGAGHAAITYPAGGLLFGLHSNTNFYWANTTAGTYSMVLGNTGNLTLGSNTLIAGSAGSSYFNGGNVGIGTASPGVKLDVNGTVRAASYIGDGSQLTGISASGSGSVIQSQFTQVCGGTLGTYSLMPYGNQTPTVGNGIRWISATITPRSANNKIRVHVLSYMSTDNANMIIAALFGPFTTAPIVSQPAVATSNFFTREAAVIYPIIIDYEAPAGTTLPIGFFSNFGGQNGQFVRLNHTSQFSNLYGGTVCSSISLTEVAP